MLTYALALVDARADLDGLAPLAHRDLADDAFRIAHDVDLRPGFVCGRSRLLAAPADLPGRSIIAGARPPPNSAAARRRELAYLSQ